MAPSFDANELRRIAEEADGTREKTLALIVDNGNLALVPESNSNVGPSDIRIETPYSGAGMRSVGELLLKYQKKALTIPAEIDALFSSQSAVEKFVLPYYARMMSPDDLKRKRDELFAIDVVGVCHVPGSVTTGVTAGIYGLRLTSEGGIELT
jgi:hypothetical protein